PNSGTGRAGRGAWRVHRIRCNPRTSAARSAGFGCPAAGSLVEGLAAMAGPPGSRCPIRISAQSGVQVVGWTKRYHILFICEWLDPGLSCEPRGPARPCSKYCDRLPGVLGTDLLVLDERLCDRVHITQQYLRQ